MKYVVSIAPEAEARIIEAFIYIQHDSPENAARWLRGIYTKIETLAMFPNGSAAAREQAYLPGRNLRQMHYKNPTASFSK